MAEPFDVVVIGAGPGGYVAAIRAGQHGLRTALVEKDAKLGGTCLHRGCIPTKSLLYTAELYSHVQHAATFGIQVTGATLDWAQAQKHKAKVVTKGAAGIDYLMKKNQVTVVKGYGRLAGKGKVEVTAADGSKQLLATQHVILATGSVPKSLPNVVVDHKRILNSDSILELGVVPKGLIVLGAGAVGVEFASIFAHLGTEVSLIEFMPAVLPIEDADISKEIEKQLKRRKIDVRTGTKLERVEVTDSHVRCTGVGPDGKEVSLAAEYLLSAVGRQPLTADVGLDKTNIKLEKNGTIAVDAMMRTSEPGVFAVGDITPHPWLAHCASAQALVAVDFIAGKAPRPINYDRIPSATYCYPEVASVGLTEKKARERGYDVKVGTFPFSAITKASISEEGGLGFVKIVADKKYDEVLGVHLIGPKATELLGEASLGLQLETTTEEIALTVHAHPTLSEIMKEAAEATLGHAIHI